jgi:flavorubredoxin
MEKRRLTEDVYYVGCADWDRRLFDSLIPLPDGTSYNSYVVIGKQKTAIIDTVDPAFTDVWINQVKALELPSIDYIIANHAEQDHSGSLVKALEHFPEAKIVTNAKCRDFLKNFMPLADEQFHIIDDKEILDLGGKTLQFYLTPWVHWPETMMTHCPEVKTLFSCDLFGSHYAGSELFVEDEEVIYHAAKRYYAEIMMPFRVNVRKHVELVERLNPAIIATSHGPAYNHPQFIIDAHKSWTSDTVKNEVLILYVSMHDSTKQMVQYFVQELVSRKIPVKEINLVNADLGKIAMELVDAATVIIGSPTVLAGAHPAAVYAAFLANALRPKTKYVSIIGSYSWGGKMVEQLSSLIPNLKAEVLPPVVIQGYPRPTHVAELAKLAELIAQKHSCLNSPK